MVEINDKVSADMFAEGAESNLKMQSRVHVRCDRSKVSYAMTLPDFGECETMWRTPTMIFVKE